MNGIEDLEKGENMPDGICEKNSLFSFRNRSFKSEKVGK
jgi:hypothetical protein